MPPAITPIYAALLGLLFILLSVRVIQLRRQESVALGDGGNENCDDVSMSDVTSDIHKHGVDGQHDDQCRSGA